MKKIILTLISTAIITAGCTTYYPEHKVVVPAHSTTVVKTSPAVIVR